MSSGEPSAKQVRVQAENIGGIDETDVSFLPGVTILAGRNATNRTSFLQAIMAGLGSKKASLKGDAEQGRVKLSVGTQEYTRLLNRNGRSVSFEGRPLLENAEVADLFAFLLEDNDARQAVINGLNLHEVIMRPIDTEEIKFKIQSLQEEQRRLNQRLDDLEGVDVQISNLKQDKAQLENKCQKKQEKLEKTKNSISRSDQLLTDTKQKKSDLEEKLNDLQKRRSEIEDIRHRLSTEQESKDALRKESKQVTERLSELNAYSNSTVNEVQNRITDLRERKAALDSKISRLRHITQFNENTLAGDETLIQPLENSTDSPSTGLVSNQRRTCWTCGSEIKKSRIEETIGKLKDFECDLIEERRQIEEHLSELVDEQQEIEQLQEQRQTLQKREQQLTTELEQRKQNISKLKNRRSSIQSTVEGLEKEVEELRSEEYDEILDLHKEANQYEFEIDSIEASIAEIEDQIAALQSQVKERIGLEDEQKRIGAQLTSLRTKINRLEEDAITEFNDHMQTILEILEYKNIARIWIERTETEVQDGRRKVTKSKFDLHIVRQSPSGVNYEDTVDHLSESEREVTGLIFALAGYLVHNITEECPFIILDSLEAIDSERIAALVDYLQNYCKYLIVALLDEDAEALDSDYPRITEI